MKILATPKNTPGTEPIIRYAIRGSVPGGRVIFCPKNMDGTKPIKNPTRNPLIKDKKTNTILFITLSSITISNILLQGISNFND